MPVVGVHAAQQSSRMALEGQYTPSRLNAFMYQRLVARNVYVVSHSACGMQHRDVHCTVYHRCEKTECCYVQDLSVCVNLWQFCNCFSLLQESEVIFKARRFHIHFWLGSAVDLTRETYDIP